MDMAEHRHERFRQTTEAITRQLAMTMGILAIVACNMMTWEKPGWGEARQKELKALNERDALDPDNFPDKASYRKAWRIADGKLQDAFAERLDLEGGEAEDERG